MPRYYPETVCVDGGVFRTMYYDVGSVFQSVTTGHAYNTIVQSPRRRRLTPAPHQCAQFTYLTSSKTRTTLSPSNKSSLTILGGLARESPVPTAFHSLRSKARITSRPRRPEAIVGEVVIGSCGQPCVCMYRVWMEDVG